RLFYQGSCCFDRMGRVKGEDSRDACPATNAASHRKTAGIKQKPGRTWLKTMAEHIVKLLEEQPEHALNDTERVIITAHIRACADCRKAYQAFRISSALLRRRAEEVVEPSPFFSTRVLAALNQNGSRQPLTVATMWKAARGIVVSMVAFVVLLLALTS